MLDEEIKIFESELPNPSVIFLSFYLFHLKGRHMEAHREQSSHLLLHSPNARQKPGAQNSTRVSQTGGRDLNTKAITCYLLAYTLTGS